MKKNYPYSLISVLIETNIICIFSTKYMNKKIGLDFFWQILKHIYTSFYSAVSDKV